jgi:transposase InsO family protein
VTSVLVEQITTERATRKVPIRTSCKALGVSESWYYKHRARPVSDRDQRREALTEAIWGFYRDSDYTYGSPRITLDLWEAGWQVSVNTVAAIMAEYGWAGRERPRRRSLTRQGKRRAAPDRLGRNFTADHVDQAWCGDVTFIRTAEGPMYLATVIDLYSRRCLGYAMSAHHDQELTIASLRMAAATRGGRRPRTIFHTDRGGEYVGSDHAKACRRLGLVQSMGRVASALDNAVAESFNSTLKTEFVYRRAFTTRAQARAQIGAWIDTFYNRRRRHSACGGLSPMQYENHNRQRSAA